MTFLRATLLSGAILLAAASLGALQMHQQPSAQRLVIASITALAAPLFWPGTSDSGTGSAMRVATWSALCAVIAGLFLLVIGRGRQAVAPVASASAMLMLVLAVTHALAAAIETRLRAGSLDAMAARDIAGATATLALALLGAMPLWLGPAAELISGAQPWALDAVVALSPLTHLAVASGNDLLHNEWLYDHSNLSKLAVSYPAMPAVLAGYASILLALAAFPLAQRTLRRRSPGAHPPCSTPEEVR